MNMGHTIVDIEDLYSNGNSIEDIVKKTKSSREFVEDVIKTMIIKEDYPGEDDYPS
jgi:hypothetical protein